MQSFCAIHLSDLASFFGVSPASADTASLSIYEAAVTFMTNIVTYVQNALAVVRYHLKAYTVLSALNAFLCDGALGCLFGYSGTSTQPLGAYSVEFGALNIVFNSTVLTYFTSTGLLLVLLIIDRGFPLFFLPFGMLMRSMPYMRQFGSLLIALSISFMIVYPFVLAAFQTSATALLQPPSTAACGVVNVEKYNEQKFISASGGGTSTVGALANIVSDGSNFYYEEYFDKCPDPFVIEEHSDPYADPGGALLFAGRAFIIGVFIPMLALLSAIASTAYIARFYGEDMDLGRLTQLV